MTLLVAGLILAPLGCASADDRVIVTVIEYFPAEDCRRSRLLAGSAELWGAYDDSRRHLEATTAGFEGRATPDGTCLYLADFAQIVADDPRYAGCVTADGLDCCAAVDTLSSAPFCDDAAPACAP